MPKERAKKTRQHAPSASLASRKLAADGATEQIELGALESASGNEILSALSAPKPTVSKKAKQQQKHEAWLQHLQESQAPYSKSHARRLKRKEKESLSTGLDDMQAVLADLQAEADAVQPATIADSEVKQDKDGMQQDSGSSSAKPKASALIGEGKGQPLSKAQRKRALAAEAARLPLVMSNPAFAANPFATIRTHVSNTLVKHDNATQ